MRRKFIPALRRKHGVDINTMIYQQDGVTPHTSNVSLEYLCRYFPGDRLISCRTDNRWSAHSPDLSPPDLFLWGYLKERVYDNNLQTIDALKENIRREIRRIPREMLDRVINNFNVRVATVIQTRGAWIEYVINYWTTLRNCVVRKEKQCHTKLSCLCEMFQVEKLMWKLCSRNDRPTKLFTFYWTTLYYFFLLFYISLWTNLFEIGFAECLA